MPRIFSPLKKQIQNDSIGDKWWEGAENLLDKMSRRDAERFLESLSDGERHDDFSALIQARFVQSPAELRKATSQAAAAELRHRLEVDPNVSLIAELFKERKGNALLHEDAIRKAIEKEDDGRAADEIVKLIYSLNLEQKKALLNAFRKSQRRPKSTRTPSAKRW